MRIALVGYGKMGRMLREEALIASHEVVSIIDPYCSDGAVSGRSLSDLPLDDLDVVIDFSSPESVLSNIFFYIERGLSAVIGTTGWYSHLDEVRTAMEGKESALIYSGNFSIGVAILLRSVSYMASLIDRVDSYDVAVEEIHHRMKADSPSGTAEMISAILLEKISSKKRAVYGTPSEKIRKDELEIVSMRLGSVVGKHRVIFDSDVDTIEISHEAKSRMGFAYGAVKAACWIRGRRGIFSMSDFLNDLLGGN